MSRMGGRRGARAEKKAACSNSLAWGSCAEMRKRGGSRMKFGKLKLRSWHFPRPLTACRTQGVFQDLGKFRGKKNFSNREK